MKTLVKKDLCVFPSLTAPINNRWLVCGVLVCVCVRVCVHVGETGCAHKLYILYWGAEKGYSGATRPRRQLSAPLPAPHSSPGCQTHIEQTRHRLCSPPPPHPTLVLLADRYSSSPFIWPELERSRTSWRKPNTERSPPSQGTVCVLVFAT